MYKSIFASKTLWGVGIAGIIALGQVFGISVADTLVAQIVQVLSVVFGAYGFRSALK